MERAIKIYGEQGEKDQANLARELLTEIDTAIAKATGAA
jgi:hypothetical protein